MTKIEKLTEEQEKRLPILREYYRSLGLSTEPLKKNEVEKAISAHYARINKKAPKFFYFSSPLMCMLASSIIEKLLDKKEVDQLWGQLGDQLGGQLGDQLKSQLGDQLKSQLGGQLKSQLWDQLWGQLWGQLWDQLKSQLGGQLGNQLGNQLKSQLGGQLGNQLGGQLWGQLGDQLRDQLKSQLGDQLKSQLGNQLGNQLWGQLGDQLGGQLGDQLWGQLWGQLKSQLWDQLGGQLGGQLWGQDFLDLNYLYGNLSVYWISFYEFAKEIGVKYNDWCLDVLDGWNDIAKSCFHFWPKEGFCLVSEKPTHIYMRNNRLHADGKMSVEFSDGWGIYSYDGTRIPEKYGSVKAKDWQAKWLTEETNATFKMILIKGMGYEKILHDLEAKKLDSYREYELLKIDNVDVEPIHLLKMICPSTNQIHVGRVPPSCVSAREAATLRNHGIDPESFAWEH